MTHDTSTAPHVAIVGGGFTGLSAALRLVDKGMRVTVFESDDSLGGLAGGFSVGGHVLERFYHHWFNNDRYVIDLVREIGRSDDVILRPTSTGMYYAKSMFKLSSPLDVLKFSPLGFLDRIRLGLVVVKARAVKDWMTLEGRTARDWLIGMCGETVYRVVWEPLLVGKFGPFADKVSAVWFWKKIALRGGSRSSDGREVLAYYKGGFAALADAMGEEIRKKGGRIELRTGVVGLDVADGRVRAVETAAGRVPVDAVLATPALPHIADLMEGTVPADYLAKLRRIRYLANVCLVLVLDRSLSSTYWLNVGDPDFPFVGVIEHTNFEPPESYGGKHIVYLSKYLPESDALYRMSDDELLAFALPHIRRMFPNFDPSWVSEHHVWRAAHAQPIMEMHYSKLMPGMETPLSNAFISTMAQVYPEDRGTNYAIREGWKTADLIADRLTGVDAEAGRGTGLPRPSTAA